MRSGIEWHEQDRPLDETNTTIQLERSRDWIQFTLDQPMDAPLPEAEELAQASLDDAKELAEEHGVELRARMVRARALGEA